MAVEPARLISDLNTSFPRNIDLIREGDDHIRLLKKTVKDTFPRVNTVVDMSSDKLNHLDKTFGATDKDGNVTMTGAITMTKDRTFSAAGNRLQNVGAPTADNDAVTKAYVDSPETRSRNWPIGSVYISMSETSPSTTLGFGTWRRVGQGRVLMGSGTGTDENGQSENFVIGNMGGNYTQGIGINHLPPHNFNFSGRTSRGGNHFHSSGTESFFHNGPSYNQRNVPGGATWIFGNGSTDFAGEHDHEFSGVTNTIGEGHRFGLVQPSLVVAFWERTA